MKTFIFVVGTSIAIALVGITALIWLAVFIDESDINWTKPIDIIADHAEKTARLVKSMRGTDEENK